MLTSTAYYTPSINTDKILINFFKFIKKIICLYTEELRN